MNVSGRGTTAITVEISMAYSENKISIDHQGQEYSADYKVANGIVSVVMKDGEGIYRETSTFIDGSTAEAVAKSLLGEMLKDMSLL